MHLKFHSEDKYLSQAEELLSLYLSGKLPELISPNCIDTEFIRQVHGYLSSSLFISMLSDDLAMDGNIDWENMDWDDNIEDDVVNEVCRRLQWLYGKQGMIKTDKYFVAKILEMLDDVGTDGFIRDLS